MNVFGTCSAWSLSTVVLRFLIALIRGLKDVTDFLTGAALTCGVGLPIILMHTDVVRKELRTLVLSRPSC